MGREVGLASTAWIWGRTYTQDPDVRLVYLNSGASNSTYPVQSQVSFISETGCIFVVLYTFFQRVPGVLDAETDSSVFRARHSSQIMSQKRLVCSSSCFPLRKPASKSFLGRGHVKHHRMTCYGWMQYVALLCVYNVWFYVLDCLELSRQCRVQCNISPPPLPPPVISSWAFYSTIQCRYGYKIDIISSLLRQKSKDVGLARLIQAAVYPLTA